jgi:hypothetical protein
MIKESLYSGTGTLISLIIVSLTITVSVSDKYGYLRIKLSYLFFGDPQEISAMHVTINNICFIAQR